MIFQCVIKKRLLTTGLLVILLCGCSAGLQSFKQGKLALEQENFDQAVSKFLAASEQNPTNRQYLLDLKYAKSKAALTHKKKGNDLYLRQFYVEALQEYQLAATMDGSLFTALDGANKCRNQLQVASLINTAEELLQQKKPDAALDQLQKALHILPNSETALQLKDKIKETQFSLVDGIELDVLSRDPIALNFHDAKLTTVFEILTKLSGINFILDEDLQNNRTSLYLEQASFAQAMELVLRMNNLEKKILNKKTIILYPKTRDKQKQFEDQVIQVFYLSHMGAKNAVKLLRSMLQVRKVFIQEELNAVVIRDQPDVIRLAQKLIEAIDRGNSEVVFDLELIEVNQSDDLELGVKLSDYSVSAGLSQAGSGVIAASSLAATDATDGLASSLSNLKSFYSLPTATFNFAKTKADTEILANPKIRVRNKEKAKVHIGSREPIVTVTTDDGVTSDSVSYIDVGVKLEIEPTVQLDQTIVARVALEVSNVSGRETTSSGTVVITISTTTADTALTLLDGEQTIIGGLIRSDKTKTKYKIPLLGDIPFIGELFNAQEDSKNKREILLSITPHIVRSVHVPTNDSATVWSGSEDDFRFGRNFGTFADDYQNEQKNPKSSKENLAPQQPEPEPGKKPLRDEQKIETSPDHSVENTTLEPRTESSQKSTK